MRSLLHLGVLAVGLASANATLAQNLPSPESLRASAGETASLFDEYRQIMRDADPSVRLAAFAELARVDDPLVRQMAYDEGFSSGDRNLRALALRYSFFDRATVIIEFPETEDAPVSITLRENNLTTGEFRFSYSGTYSGRVQGLNVTLNMPRDCTANLDLQETNRLVGEWVCADETWAIEVDLLG